VKVKGWTAMSYWCWIYRILVTMFRVGETVKLKGLQICLKFQTEKYKARENCCVLRTKAVIPEMMPCNL